MLFKKKIDKEKLKDEIIEVLKTVYDPEIPVDVYELGLIYAIDIDDDANVQIMMTLTAPNCPVAESLPIEVKTKAATVEGVKSVDVKLVWEPPWNRQMMSDEAKLTLGFF
jgi:FeS assembly SUF system protein